MMKSPFFFVFALALCLLWSPDRSFSMEADIGRTITGVDLSPDGKRLCLRFTGAAGKHMAFVMERPYRLVVDFLDTSLGQVRRRIPGESPSLAEVRMGQHDSQARMVADFGSNPVPPFKINRVGDRVFIVFQGGAVRTEARKEVLDSSPVRGKTGSRSSVLAARTTPRSRTSALAVRKARVEGNLIFLELASALAGGRRYRLVLDCDLQDLSVRNATVSDASGAVKRFDFVKAGDSGAVQKAEVEATKGPTKGDERIRGKHVSAQKFKWGLPAAFRKDLTPTAEKTGPFRLEGFKLKARQLADQR